MLPKINNLEVYETRLGLVVSQEINSFYHIAILRTVFHI